MSFFVDGSLDQISMIWPIWIVPIPFLASSSGPGQALPRASTTLAVSSAARSVSLSGVVAVIMRWSPSCGRGRVERPVRSDQ